VNFVGPLTRTKRGNPAIPVVLDSFSKFVSLFLVRRMARSVVIDCLERGYFPAYGTPKSIVMITSVYFDPKRSRICASDGVLTIFIPLLITPRLRLRSESTGTSNQR